MKTRWIAPMVGPAVLTWAGPARAQAAWECYRIVNGEFDRFFRA
jgi:hypothetical protein